MDLRDLKLFLHLAESHHFGRTAKAMHVSRRRSPARYSGWKILGQPLFLRDNRTVQLTDAGEQLKEFAQQTLLQYQQLKRSRPARPFAERRTAAVLFGDRGVPPAADPRSLPRAAPAGRD